MTRYLIMIFLGGLLPLSAALSIGAAIAQEAPKFRIDKFNVEGNTLLDQADVDASLNPFIGKQRDFGDVQQALEALEAVYRLRGYDYVSVLLPEQLLERGEVKLQVVEARIRSVIIEGEKHFGKANIRASVPGIKEGGIPLMNDISASLRVANENPAKKIRVLFAAGERDEDLEATIRVADEVPWKIGATLDNTGSGHTGSGRLGLTYQNSNLFDSDHILTLQYQTSVKKPKDLSVVAVAYRIPFYALGDVLDIYATYSDVNSGTINAGPVALAITGKGNSLGFKYTAKLKRIDDYEHELAAGLDHKEFKTGIAAGTLQLGNSLSVHPFSVQYSGRWTGEARDLNFNLGFVQNIPGGKDGGQDAISLARAGARKDYSLARAGGGFSQSLPDDWQVRAVAAAQWSRLPLIPGDQFGVGGASSVRGFEEREVSNDKGIQGNLELYSPELCAKALPGQQCRLLAFYDFGYLYRINPLVGEVAQDHVSSAGLGLRWAVSRDLSLQADYGQVRLGTSTRKSGDSKLHLRLGISF